MQKKGLTGPEAGDMSFRHDEGSIRVPFGALFLGVLAGIPPKGSKYQFSRYVEDLRAPKSIYYTTTWTLLGYILCYMLYTIHYAIYSTPYTITWTLQETLNPSTPKP